MKHALLLIATLLAATNALADDPPAKLDHMNACRADVQKLCPNVQPGGGRIVACLKQNADSVSDACKQKLQQMQARKNNRQSTPPSTPPAASNTSN